MGFLESFSLEQLIDLGLVAMVVLAGHQFLFAKGVSITKGEAQDLPAKGVGKITNELKNVEATLRELISEAGAAGSRLNHSLLERQHELEQLLGQLRSSESNIRGQQLSNRERGSEESSQAELQSEVIDDLPNQTWLEEKKEDSLGSKAQLKQDNVSISAEALKSSRTQQKPDSKLQSLKEKVEVAVAKSNETTEAPPINSAIDPVAYRVAQRLLGRGEEIHVVSRKLDMPLAEVRLLDRLLRKKTEAEVGHQEEVQDEESTFDGGTAEIQREVALI